MNIDTVGELIVFLVGLCLGCAILGISVDLITQFFFWLISSIWMMIR